MARTQFRILYRDFLFRVVDPDLLSPHSPGDAHRILAQLAAILVFFSAAISLPAFDINDDGFSAPVRLFFSWRLEHFLIATSMLAVGVFAIMSWGSLFPEHRDVLILAPLPVRAATILFAKMAAVATALLLAVVAMHVVAGLVWPLMLSGNGQPIVMPSLTRDAAQAPIQVADLRRVMEHDLAGAVRDGWLSPAGGGGLAIATSQHGVRQVLTYGVARQDSIFQIGSVTKTFTALALAQLVHEGRFQLDTPVIDLLPNPAPLAGTGVTGPPMTLGDLATHYSGLPMMPPGSRPEKARAAFENFRIDDLRNYLRRHSLERPAEARFGYSNLGFAVLGHVLSRETGADYADLIRERVTDPIGLADTVVQLSPEQRSRLLPGYDDAGSPVESWQVGALTPASAMYSTAPDLLTWLEAHLHPSGELREPVALALRPLRAPRERERIGLAWQMNPEATSFHHDGAVGGYTTDVFFNTRDDLAIVVLANRAAGVVAAAPRVADHIQARLAGTSPNSLDDVTIPARGGVRAMGRTLLAYWLTMIAASAFIAFALIGIQGPAIALLPRRVFLRASPILQFIAFAAIVGVYLLQPIGFTSDDLVAAQAGGILSASPAYWFLGLFHFLAGANVMPVLASRAAGGLAFAMALGGLAYGLSYLQTLRRIAEEPDVVATSMRSLPFIGHGPTRGLTDFAIKTLFRSAQARVVMAFYWGLGVAFGIAFVKTPRGQQLSNGYEGGAWYETSVPLLLASILVMGASVLAARSAFAIPRDLESNWIFRLLQLREPAGYATARRRAFTAISVVPVSLASAVVFLWMWPAVPALGHVAALTLLGLVLVEVVDFGERRIPFASSYLPGKSKINVAIVVIVLIVIPLAVGAATIEREALQDVRKFVEMLAVLVATWALAVVCRTWFTPAPEGLPPFDVEPEHRAVTLELWDSRLTPERRT